MLVWFVDWDSREAFMFFDRMVRGFFAGFGYFIFLEYMFVEIIVDVNAVVKLLNELYQQLLFRKSS